MTMRVFYSEHEEGKYAIGMSASSAWDQQSVGHEHQLVKTMDGYVATDECNLGFFTKLLGYQALMDNNGINPMEILSTEFPRFAVESLACIYLASGGNLSLTMEMLAQLEIQEDTGPHSSFATKSSSALNLTSTDFPALSNVEMLNNFYA